MATTTTLYATSGDGIVGGGSNTSWATARGVSTGAAAYSSQASSYLPGYASNNAGDTYTYFMYRGFCAFDLSSIPANATIISATLSFYGTGTSYTLGGGTTDNNSACIVAGTQASTTTLATSDFSLVGSTELASRVAYTSFGASGYKDFTLNSSGRAHLTSALGGTAKFAVRPGYDLDNTAPSDTGYSGGLAYFSDQTGTSNDPKLAVTWDIIQTFTADAKIVDLRVFPATNLLDTFDSSIGANWTFDLSGPSTHSAASVVSGEIRASASNPSSYYWSAASFSADQEAYIDLTTVGGGSPYAQVYARLQDISGGGDNFDGYAAYWPTSGSGGGLYRYDNGTPTLLGANINPSNVGAVGIRCVGSSIEYWARSTISGSWILQGTRTDSTYTSGGYIGWVIYDTGVQTSRWDNFGGGTFPRTRTTATFTADAIVKTQATQTFTADAIVYESGSKTFTADAIIKLVGSQTFTADAIVKTRATKTFTADAVINGTLYWSQGTRSNSGAVPDIGTGKGGAFATYDWNGFNGGTRCPNGDLLAVTCVGPDENTGPDFTEFVRCPAGSDPRTAGNWTRQARVGFDDDLAELWMRTFTDSSGTFMIVSGNRNVSGPSGTFPADYGGNWYQQGRTAISTDNGATWSASRIFSITGRPLLGRDGSGDQDQQMTGGYEILPDGSLIAPVAIVPNGDTSKTNMYQILVRSTDRGATWAEYGGQPYTFSASRQDAEASLVWLGDGSLACIARTKEYPLTTDAGYAMWIAISTDNGLTWPTRNRCFTSAASRPLEVVGPEGDLLVAYRTVVSGASSYTAWRQSWDNGVTWTSPVSLGVGKVNVYGQGVRVSDTRGRSGNVGFIFTEQLGLAGEMYWRELTAPSGYSEYVRRTATVTADALIVSGVATQSTRTFTADAIVQSQGLTKTVTADAIVVSVVSGAGTSTKTFTADAVVYSAPGATFSAGLVFYSNVGQDLDFWGQD